MRMMGKRPLLAPLLLAIGLLGDRPVARADLVNGDFSNGLTGWTADPTASVSVVNGQAVLSESMTAQEVDLYQDFAIPAGAQTLTFTLVSLTDEPPSANPPDAFGASLLDPGTLASLVPTVDPNTDSFYIRDLVQGVTQGEAAPGVTLSPSPTSLPLTLMLDISSLGGQQARVLFRLIGGGDSFDASVTIDDASISGGMVPEPGGLTLLAVGILGLTCHRSRGRRFITRRSFK